MSKPTETKKAAAKVEVIKINSVNEELDEVFLYREDPYVNEVKYVKPGTYKLGPLSEEAMNKEVTG